MSGNEREEERQSGEKQNTADDGFNSVGMEVDGGAYASWKAHGNGNEGGSSATAGPGRIVEVNGGGGGTNLSMIVEGPEEDEQPKSVLSSANLHEGEDDEIGGIHLRTATMKKGGEEGTDDVGAKYSAAFSPQKPGEGRGVVRYVNTIVNVNKANADGMLGGVKSMSGLNRSMSGSNTSEGMNGSLSPSIGLPINTRLASNTDGINASKRQQGRRGSIESLSFKQQRKEVLSNMKRRQRAEKITRKSKKWEKKLRSFILPFVVWGLIQVGFLVFFEIILIKTEPLSLSVYDASRRMIAISELLLLSNVLISTRAEHPLSDYNILFGAFHPVSALSSTSSSSSSSTSIHADGGRGWGEEKEVYGSSIGKSRTNRDDSSPHNSMGHISLFDSTSSRTSFGVERRDVFKREGSDGPSRALFASSPASSPSFFFNYSDPLVHTEWVEGIVSEIDTAADILEYSYNSLIYGGHLNHTDPSSPSTHTGVIGVGDLPVYRDPHQRVLLYESDTCLLDDVDAQHCPTVGSEHYELLTGGLDVITRRYLRLARWIADEGRQSSEQRSQAGGGGSGVDNGEGDPTGYLNQQRAFELTSVLYPHIKAGMKKSLYYFIEEAEEKKTLIFATQITLFALSQFLLLAFYVAVIRPFLKKVEVECEKSITLLARVPKKFNLDTIVEQVASSQFGKNKGGGEGENGEGGGKRKSLNKIFPAKGV